MTNDIMIETVCSGPLAVNTYIVYLENASVCAVIDPGAAEPVLKKLTVLSLTPDAVLLTHGHFDHMGGAAEIAERFHCGIYVHDKDLPLLDDAYRNLSLPFMGEALTVPGGIAFSKMQDPDGTVTFAGISFKIVNTPGHTEGSCSFLMGEDIIFSGDTLFALSTGRTDFPGGSFDSLCRSVKTLLDLDGDRKVYPGHGEPTHLQLERHSNPIVRYLA